MEDSRSHSLVVVRLGPGYNTLPGRTHFIQGWAILKYLYHGNQEFHIYKYYVTMRLGFTIGTVGLFLGDTIAFRNYMDNIDRPVLTILFG